MTNKHTSNEQIAPSDILGEVEDLQNGITSKFPTEIFPDAVQLIINETYDKLSYPIDFTAASLLYATSVAIGNTKTVEIMQGYQQNAVLYIALVGQRGTNKSHPLSFALAPLEQQDRKSYESYVDKRDEFDTISQLSKKERDELGTNELIKPVLEQLLVSDFTPESLISVLNHNKRGLGVYSDELTAWISNFNRYNKGSDEQFWLSNFSGKPIRINRKTSEPIYIPDPFISVIGTIQPGVLTELSNKRTENGFLDRILFAFPAHLEKEYWTENELDYEVVISWNNIISNLLSIDRGNESPSEVLKFSQEAKSKIFLWQRELTDRSNETSDDDLKGIIAKIEQYTIRFCLCLEQLKYACHESSGKIINESSVDGAIRLSEYFINSALQVRNKIKKADSGFSEIQKQIYSSLPNEFSTNDAVTLSTQNLEEGMSESTIKRWLKDETLFQKVSHGNYRKL
jgi:hypothetical protein